MCDYRPSANASSAGLLLTVYLDVFHLELRHQFEKLKCRKLSSEEKKIFKAYSLEYFASRVEAPDSPSANAVEGMDWWLVLYCLANYSAVNLLSIFNREIPLLNTLQPAKD